MKKDARLMPMMSVKSVDQVRAFYVEKLGFAHRMGMLGKDGQLDFCSVSLSGADIMLMRVQQPMEDAGPTPSKRAVELYIEVENVDRYHEQVKKSGVKVAEPLTDQWWGDRTFTVLDPSGYQIWFFQNVGEMKPPQGAKIV